MNGLQGFDPLLFLGITNIKPGEKDAFSYELLSKISEYIFVRIAELLEESDLKNTDNPDQLFNVAKDKIPHLDTKIKTFLEDFKNDYQKNYYNSVQL